MPSKIKSKTDNRGVSMRAVRDALGFTQEEMAHELKCSLSTVVRCERLGILPSAKAVRVNFDNLARQTEVTA